ncbi:MAG: DUF4349 domain-containing protein [Maricaulaceae bacterium]|nr:DUF4349 domain-containing protein [Maricaulaceae bacterium]
MRLSVICAALAAALALSACEGGPEHYAEPAPQAAPDSVTRARMAAAPSGGVAAREAVTDSETAGDGESIHPAGMLLAYAYAATVEAPGAAVRGLMEAHEGACRAAGPQVCVVTGGSVNAWGEDNVRGALSIRADPRWLQNFRDGLRGDAEAAGGRLVSLSTSTEDLTRQITDTEARLEAQERLRDRLLALLDRQSGTVGDLLQVERELARVQGGIDSARAQIAVMRARVDMSRLDISYQSRPSPVGRDVFRPLKDALDGAVANTVRALAFLVEAAAFLLPFAIILILLLWLGLRALRRRKAKKAAPPQPAG